jgi:hypothetical protein
MIIRDAVFLVTDRAVSNAYRSLALDAQTTSWLDSPDIFSLNLGGTPERLFQTFPTPRGEFYCIGGSSNFHHLDLINLKRLRVKHNSPLQLILVDQHMDCVRYEEKRKWLHCGNWISYAFQKGMISKVAMVGCRDYRSLTSFDARLEQAGALRYFPNPMEVDFEGFFEPRLPTYLSIDTDVLSKPSDYGLGLHTLDIVLASPFWDFLGGSNWVGAFLHGHVTDNRRFLDVFRTSIFSPAARAAGNPFRDFKVNFVHCVWPKLLASLFLKELAMEEQLEIMLALYSRAEKARSIHHMQFEV